MNHDLFPETLLVQVADGRPYTTSLLVAEHFHKLHKNVIQTIEKLMAEAVYGDEHRLNFQPISELDHRNRKRLVYRMDRLTMSVLIGRMTGKNPLRWQADCHEAFERIETALAARTTRYADALHQVRPALRPVVEGTEQGLSRGAIAQPLGKSAGSVTYHRTQARRLGLLAVPRTAAKVAA